MTKSFERGFTLIELLVVIAIVGLLSSAIFATLNEVRAKGRDARRLADIDQMQKALELYYDDNGTYPQRSNARSANDTGETCSGAPGYGNTAWCGLKQDLEPYYAIPEDPLGPNGTYRYWYDSNSGDNYQMYGLMIEEFEFEGNFPIADNDGGYYNADGGALDGTSYEVGDLPPYCIRQYPGGDTGANWLTITSKICAGD